MLDLLSAMDKVQVWSVITAQKLPLIYFFTDLLSTTATIASIMVLNG